MSKDSESLFKERLVPARNGSGELFEISYEVRTQPVTCLGMTFDNDEKRREHFLRSCARNSRTWSSVRSRISFNGMASPMTRTCPTVESRLQRMRRSCLRNI